MRAVGRAHEALRRLGGEERVDPSSRKRLAGGRRTRARRGARGLDVNLDARVPDRLRVVHRHRERERAVGLAGRDVHAAQLDVAGLHVREASLDVPATVIAAVCAAHQLASVDELAHGSLRGADCGVARLRPDRWLRRRFGRVGAHQPEFLQDLQWTSVHAASARRRLRRVRRGGRKRGEAGSDDGRREPARAAAHARRRNRDADASGEGAIQLPSNTTSPWIACRCASSASAARSNTRCAAGRSIDQRFHPVEPELDGRDMNVCACVTPHLRERGVGVRQRERWPQQRELAIDLVGGEREEPAERRAGVCHCAGDDELEHVVGPARRLLRAPARRCARCRTQPRRRSRGRFRGAGNAPGRRCAGARCARVRERARRAADARRCRRARRAGDRRRRTRAAARRGRGRGGTARAPRALPGSPSSQGDAGGQATELGAHALRVPLVGVHLNCLPQMRAASAVTRGP